MAGLTEDGLEIKRTADVRSSIRAALRSEFGQSVNLGPETVIGRIIDTVAGEIGLSWEGLQALWDSTDPANAYGQLLVNLASIHGVFKKGGEYTTGTITATGTPGTFIERESQVENSTTSVYFETVDDATIDGGGSVDIAVRSLDFGAFPTAANEIDTIRTPVTGWDSVSNAASFDEGQVEERDDDLKSRWLKTRGGQTENDDYELREKLLNLTGIEEVRVISNRTRSTDSYGTPEGEFVTFLFPDPQTGAGADIDEDEVVSTIFNYLPPAIGSHGSRKFTVTADDDITHEVGYTPFAEPQVFIRLSNMVTTSDYPSNGDTLVKEAIVEAVNELQGGNDVEIIDLFVVMDSFDSVKSVTIETSEGGSFGVNNFTIDPNEIARIETSDVSIV